MNDCLDNNIKITWLKNNIDLIQLHLDKTQYDY